MMHIASPCSRQASREVATTLRLRLRHSDVPSHHMLREGAQLVPTIPLTIPPQFAEDKSTTRLTADTCFTRVNPRKVTHCDVTLSN
eukprot:1360506-Amorphochlora_amoeboformis.AAC.1